MRSSGSPPPFRAPTRKACASFQFDTPVPYAAELEEAHLPQVADVVSMARLQLSY